MDIRAAASQIKSIWIKEKSGFPLFLRFGPAGRSCVLNFPQQRLFARPHVLKVRQERRKLAVSGAENADFPIHRGSPPVRFSPIIPEAAGAVNRVSGKKSALRQNVHPPGFPAHRWMNGGGQGCFPAGISAAGRRTDRRSRCIGMKQICAAPYESVLKLCSVEGQATYSPYRVSAFCRPLGRPPCAFLSAIPLRSGTHKRVTVFAVLVLWPAGGRLCGKILKNVVANLRALCYDRKAINAKVFYAARRRGGADGPARCCSCRRR